MSEENGFRQAASRVFDPEEVEGVLSSRFYTPTAPAPARAARGREDKPLHYKVICISMYTEDLKHLDEMVDALKSRGLTKANRSALIRYALDHVNLDQIPRGL